MPKLLQALGFPGFYSDFFISARWRYRKGHVENVRWNILPPGTANIDVSGRWGGIVARPLLPISPVSTATVRWKGTAERGTVALKESGEIGWSADVKASERLSESFNTLTLEFPKDTPVNRDGWIYVGLGGGPGTMMVDRIELK